MFHRTGDVGAKALTSGRLSLADGGDDGASGRHLKHPRHSLPHAPSHVKSSTAGDVSCSLLPSTSALTTATVAKHNPHLARAVAFMAKVEGRRRRSSSTNDDEWLAGGGVKGDGLAVDDIGLAMGDAHLNQLHHHHHRSSSSGGGSATAIAMRRKSSNVTLEPLSRPPSSGGNRGCCHWDGSVSSRLVRLVLGSGLCSSDVPCSCLALQPQVQPCFALTVLFKVFSRYSGWIDVSWHGDHAGPSPLSYDRTRRVVFTGAHRGPCAPLLLQATVSTTSALGTRAAARTCFNA